MTAPLFDARILDARPTDVETVLGIAESSLLSKWSEADYQLEIERPDSIFLVAWADRVRGFVVGRVLPGGDESAHVAELNNIGVALKFRRLGIASALLGQFIRSAQQRGACKVILEVRSGNGMAIKFYEKLGFSRQCVRRSFYSHPTEDANVMTANI